MTVSIAFKQKTNMNKFEALGINENVVKAITELGFENPTPVQVKAIPLILSNEQDIVALAQTGTGKTAAFGLPLTQLINFDSKDVQALILCPTRELCMQITKDLQSYTKYTKGARIVAIYGGASIERQTDEIRRGAQVIVATPGRMVDMLDRKRVNIKNVKWAVLDEADEMLNMGFQEDLNTILSDTPATKKTFLFSATMPSEVSRIAKKYMSNPTEITVGNKNEGAANIEHVYYVVQSRDRYPALKRIVDFSPDIFGIVFCRTRAETQDVADSLIKDGYSADCLHGDLSQAQRDFVMKRYRSKSIQMLVATDVAARGIDVDDVTHVINYNLPDEIENYTHRSGRTARAGKSGTSIVIISNRDSGKIKTIERIIGKKFQFKKVPNGAEVCEKQLVHLVNKLKNVAINEKGISSFLPQIYDQLADLSKEDIIQRFMSQEFGKLFEYYKKAPDLNSGGESTRSVSRNPNAKQLFINLGEMDGLNEQQMKEYINTTAQIEKGGVLAANIKGTYSFLEVEPADADAIMAAFKEGNYKGRNVRIDDSTGRPAGGGRREGGSGGGGFKKSYGPRSTGNGKGFGERRSYSDKPYSSRGGSEGGERSFERSGGERSPERAGGERKSKFAREKRPRRSF